MANGINTNLAALGVQRVLSGTTGQLDTAMQRLASGRRINSARDDAAGQAIAAQMTTQVRGHTQGVRNLADGISLAQTGEGGLESITQNLQRIRELAVQAANFTNSAIDRASLQEEVDQLTAEITRTANQTSFNGIRLLDGSFKNAAFQAGANVGQTIGVGALPDLRASILGQPTVTRTEAIAGSADEIQYAQTVKFGAAAPISLGTFQRDASLLAQAINSLPGSYGISAVANPNILTGSVATGASTAGSVYAFTINGLYFSVTGTGNADQDRESMFSVLNDFGIGNNYGYGTVEDLGPGRGLRLTRTDGGNITIYEDVVGSASYFGLGGLTSASGSSRASTITLTFRPPPMAGPVLFTNTGLANPSFVMPLWTALSQINFNGFSGPQSAIAAVDNALVTVSEARARLGAVMNRFEASMGAQRVAIESQTASRSRIEDADFAAEAAARMRAQILKQSGLAILAQANAVPRNVLTLLGG